MMAVFTQKPFIDDQLTYIRDNIILINRGEDGLGTLILDIYSYSYPHENRHFNPDEWNDRKLTITFADKSSFKQAYQTARSIIREKQKEQTMNHQLEIRIPEEVTKDASEEQMQHVVHSLMTYVGKPLTFDNIDVIKTELQLLAGCATALADGLELSPTKTH